MFRGMHAVTIDGKGRLPVPVKIREELGSAVVITIDTEERCLLLYPVEQWKAIEENLQRLPSFNEAARRIQRLLIGHAADIDMDSQGRLLLPSLLRDYARFDKHVLMVGQGNKFEVWDDAVWQSRREEWLAMEASTKQVLPDEMKVFSL